MIDTVFLDMDGVLVDFIGKALSVYSEYEQEQYGFQEPPPNPFKADVFLHNWPSSEWDICKVLDMEQNEFWAMIHRWNNGTFWESLEPYHWALQLIVAANRIGEVRLLTSPSNHPTCYSGKKITRDTYFSSTPIFLCEEKYLLAGSNRLLIDDNDQNIELFREAGGDAILFPRVWNANHEWKDSPMVYVGMELEKLNIDIDRDRGEAD